MGLKDVLARYAARRAHVLLVEVPGSGRARMSLEREILRRGWALAESPADADALAVCGAPGPELAAVVERLWEQMPGPRARADLVGESSPEQVLDDLERRLLDVEAQEQDGRTRPLELALEGGPGGDEGHEGHEGHEGQGNHQDHGGHEDHGGHDAEGHEGHDEDHDEGHEDHGGHGEGGHGHDHGHGDMAPGGIPLAGGGEDRDGLEMDVLHVRLGPVLPHWPAGLVLRCTLQGDVVVEAEAGLVDSDHADHAHHADHPSHAHDRERAATGHAGRGALQPPGAAVRLDNVAALLALAGWPDGHAAATRARDAILDRTGPGGPRPDGDAATTGDPQSVVGALRRRVARARMLRWSLRGLRPLTPDTLRDHALPERLAGDTYDRLLAVLDRAGDGTADLDQESGREIEHRPSPDGPSPAQWLDALPDLVTGLDLATVRLVVASLDLDPLVAREEATRA